MLVGLGVYSAWSADPDRLQARAADAENPPVLQDQRAHQAISRLEYLRVQERLAQGDTPNALAMLARMLRLDPSNRFAADRLFSVLSQRAFLVPSPKTMETNLPFLFSTPSFSADGRHLEAATADGSLTFWKAENGLWVDPPKTAARGVLVHESLTPKGVLSLRAPRTTDEDSRLPQGDLWVTLTPLPGAPRATNANRPAKAIATAIRLTSRTNEVLCYSEDVVVTAGEDHAVSAWDVTTGRLLSKTPPLESGVDSASIFPDAQRLALLTEQGLRIWDCAMNSFGGPPFHQSEELDGFDLSPDGLWVIGWKVSSDCILVWNSRNGRLQAAIRDWPLGIADEPYLSDDGRYLVSTGTSGRIRVWETHTGSPVTPELFHFPATVKVHANSALSPDNHWLATIVPDGGDRIRYDRELRLWDVRTGKVLNSPPHEPCDDLCFSCDGQELLTTAVDGATRFWQLRSDDRAWLPRQFEDVAGLPQVLPGKNSVFGVIRGTNRSATLVELISGRAVTPIGPGYSNVVSAAVCPHGDCFLTLHSGGVVRRWETASGNLIQTLSARERPGFPEWRYSPAHDRFLLLRDQSVCVGDLLHPAPACLELKVPVTVYDAQFSRDGKHVASAHSDGKVRFWNSQTGKPEKLVLDHHTRATSVEYSPEGTRLLTTSEGQAHVWSLSTGRELFPPLKHEYRFVERHMDGFLHMWAAFSADGRRIVTASAETVRVWDAESGRALIEPLRHPTWVGKASLSPDGSKVVTTCGDRGLRIWDSNTGLLLGEPMNSHTARAYRFSAQFSADGRWIVETTPGRPGERVCVWEVPTAPLPVPGTLLDLAEALGGLRLDDQGIAQPVPWQRLLELRNNIETAPAGASPEYDLWFRWFFDFEPTRKVSPHSDHSLDDFVQARLLDDHVGALRDALRVSPACVPAMVRLAQLLPEHRTEPGRGNLREAHAWADRACRLSPNDPALAELRTRISRSLASPP